MKAHIQLANILENSVGQGFGDLSFEPLALKMFASDATARELVANDSGRFGADLLRFPCDGGVPMHTHEGDHILLVIAGNGILSTPFDKVNLQPGLIYLVPSGVPHEIRAISELVLMAVGNDRRPPASPERLRLASHAPPN